MRILIVDDSPHLRKALKLAADRFGSVSVASDAAEALELLRQEHFDVVVTDYQMRKGNGYDVAKFALQRNPASSVILITAHATKDLAINSVNLNLFGFLEKPCSLAQFEEMLERAIQAANTQAKKDRYAAVGELADTLLQEIGNPLSRILLRAERLMELTESQSPPMMLDSIRGIEETTQRIFQIMRGVRTLMGEDLGDPEEKASINKIFQLIEEDCSKELARQGIELDLPKIGEHRNFMLKGSTVHWVQVFKNLIDNACDAINEGSTDAKRWIRIWVLERGEGSIRICVEDSGPGISDEIRDKIFKPLFTTRRRTDRVGTGLSVCRKIVESCGGELQHSQNEPTQFQIKAPFFSL